MGTNRDKFLDVKIQAKSENQQKYLDAIDNNYITFGVGPAGCGKTFLAVLKAMQYFKDNKVARIVLTRPAQEAGEKLGFLPGKLEEKMDPFLLPCFDAMHEFWSETAIEALMAEGALEIAPIAYMRGRTFRDAFVIVDEAQNLTVEQLKMVITRYGEGSKMVINGDHTQSDLHPFRQGSLKRAKDMVDFGITGMDLIHFNNKEDSQRHAIVGDIVEVWDKIEESSSAKKE